MRNRHDIHRNDKRGGRPVAIAPLSRSYRGWLSFAEEGLFLAILFVAPLAMGGRTDLGRLVYVGCVGALGITWLLRQAVTDNSTYRTTGVEWLLMAGAAVLLVQLIQLPSSLLQVLAPYQAEWLPLWSQQSDMASVPPAIAALQWRQISLVPDRTRIALIVYIAHASLFLVLCQRLRKLSDVERLIRQLTVAAIAMATIGLVQYLIRTDRFLGVFEHPSRDASEACSGPFSNANHFAHFLALGVGSAIAWLQQLTKDPSHYGPTGNRRLGTKRNDRSQLVGLFVSGGLALLLLAGFLSRSRGGMMAISLAVVITIGQLAARKMIRRNVVVACTVSIALFTAGLFIHGKEDVQRELDTLTAGSMESVDAGHGRRNIWMANLQATMQSPMVGLGVGSHPFVYHKFFDHPSRVIYSHAESCYVQLFTETGCLGLGLVLIALLCLGRWLWQTDLSLDGKPTTICWVAIVAGLATSCAHAAIDFPWYLTSCMSLGVILAAAAWSLANLSNDDNAAPETQEGFLSLRLPWLATGTLATALAIPSLSCLAVHAFADIHWNQYLVQSLDRDVKREKRALLVSRSPEEQHKWQRLIEKRERSMLRSLGNVLAWIPGDGRANLRMATVLLAMVEERQLKSSNGMPLTQIRDAAVRSQFPDITAQRKWLQIVLGDDLTILDKAICHAKQALAECPLEARAYLLWKEMAFVQETRQDLPDLLLAQAARVRPHDANVLFTIGRDAVLKGDLPKSLPYWRKAFHRDEETAIEIMRIVAPQVDGTAFLEMFDPNEREMTTLMYYYYKVGQPENMRKVLPTLIQRVEQRVATETGEVAAKTRLRMVEHHISLGDAAGALRHARLAVEAAPNSYEPHFVLAARLVTVKDYPAALKELSWCSRRRPQDKRISSLHSTIKQLRQIRSTAAASSQVSRSRPSTIQ